MRGAIVRQAILECLRNLVRHPLVTLASVTTIGLMLLVMGLFTTFSLNARAIARNVGQQPPVQIWMRIGASPEQIDGVESALAGDERVVEIVRKTPAQQLEEFRAELGDQADLLDGFPAEELPYTFIVRLADPSLGDAFAQSVETLAGVESLDYSDAVMDLLTTLGRWVNIATAAAMAVMGWIALLIISNMVRVAVYARGEEIAIMKSVGATNWYIRVPYILEGAVVGLLGAMGSWGLVRLGYQALHDALSPSIPLSHFLSLLPVEEATFPVLVVNLVLGILVGAGGSALAVRRHVRV